LKLAMDTLPLVYLATQMAILEVPLEVTGAQAGSVLHLAGNGKYIDASRRNPTTLGMTLPGYEQLGWHPHRAASQPVSLATVKRVNLVCRKSDTQP